MKIILTFKDPDGVYDSVHDAAEESVNAVEGVSDDEREELIESRHQEAMEALKPWVEYGEYLRVEIDTDAGTATVKKVR